MNADLHLAKDLTTTGKGNLFVVFGEPDIEIQPAGGAPAGDRLRGVYVFHPRTGAIGSDSPDAIACRLLDTAYDSESFFVRHTCFPGAGNDPYQALRNTLKPATGRIAVEVLNHLGDEGTKVSRVP